MAAMEAVLAARRTPFAEPVEPQAARGPGADLRFQVQWIFPITNAAGIHRLVLTSDCPDSQVEMQSKCSDWFPTAVFSK